MAKKDTNKAIRKAIKKLKQKQRNLDHFVQLLKTTLEQLPSDNSNQHNKD